MKVITGKDKYGDEVTCTTVTKSELGTIAEVSDILGTLDDEWRISPDACSHMVYSLAVHARYDITTDGDDKETRCQKLHKKIDEVLTFLDALWDALDHEREVALITGITTKKKIEEE